MKLKRVILALLTLGFLSISPQLSTCHAGSHLWSGAASGYWSDPANWSSGGPPSFFESAPIYVHFPSTASARRETTNDIASVQLNVLAFYGSGYQLSCTKPILILGGTVPFPYTGNIMSGGGGTNWLDSSAVLSLAQAVQLSVGAGATLEMRGAFTGGGALTKTGSGTLAYAGDAECYYLGLTTVLDGIVYNAARRYGPFDWTGYPTTTIPHDLVIGDTDPAHSPKVIFLDDSLDGGNVTMNPNATLQLGWKLFLNTLTMTGGLVEAMPSTYPELICYSNIVSHPTRLAPAEISGVSMNFLPISGQPYNEINVTGGSLIANANIYGYSSLHKTGAGELLWNGVYSMVYSNFVVQEGLLTALGDTITLKEHQHSLVVSNGAQLTVRGQGLCHAQVHLNGFGLGGTNGALVIEHDGVQFHSTMHVDTDAAIVVKNPSDTFTVVSEVVSNVVKQFRGPGELYKLGPGTLAITGNQTNAMTGGFHVQQGAVLLNNSPDVAALNGPLYIGDNLGGPPDGVIVQALQAGQLAPGVALTIDASGLLDLGKNAGTPQTAARLNGSGHLNLGTTTLTTGNNANSVFSGRITGGNASSLVKQGPGKLTLNGSSPDWTGSTVVAAGNLSLNSMQPLSPVLVSPGATLSGNGTSGPVTSDDAKITPGNSIGQLHTADFILSSSTVFEVELKGTSPGTNHDQVSVTGTVNLGGATLNPLLGFLSDYGSQIILIANDGVDPVIGTFDALSEGATILLNSRLYQISYRGGDGNDVMLTQISGGNGAQLGGVQKLANGQMQFAATGLPGIVCAVQATDSLQPPMQWTTIGTTTADAQGHLQFTDPDAPNHPIRFYRLVVP